MGEEIGRRKEEGGRRKEEIGVVMTISSIGDDTSPPA
jgi:hypothetical protein